MSSTLELNSNSKGEFHREVFFEAPSSEYAKMWKHYLHTFHNTRAGITEEILNLSYMQSTTDEMNVNPYDWVFIELPNSGIIYDLGCGSGPFRNKLDGQTIVGFDISPAEIEIARTRAGYNLARCDVARLPVKSLSADVVISTMALMLFDSLDSVLSEIYRVLKHNGIAVFLLPSSKPLNLGDMQRYSRLLLALKLTRLDYPNDVAMDKLDKLGASVGLSLISDQSVRFAYKIGSISDANHFLNSLYLPSVKGSRIDKATELVSKWVGKPMGIPLRKVIFKKPRSHPNDKRSTFQNRLQDSL